jgi:hypothetical protein
VGEWVAGSTRCSAPSPSSAPGTSEMATMPGCTGRAEDSEGTHATAVHGRPEAGHAYRCTAAHCDAMHCYIALQSSQAYLVQGWAHPLQRHPALALGAQQVGRSKVTLHGIAWRVVDVSERGRNSWHAHGWGAQDQLTRRQQCNSPAPQLQPQLQP